MRCRLQFEPSFMEEAVFWTVRSLEAEGERPITDAYYDARDSIYERGRDERAFQELDANFFVKLGLRSLFEELLEEFTLLDDPTTCRSAEGASALSGDAAMRQDGRWWDDPKMVILIKRAFGKKEEVSELYREGNLKTVLLSLQTKRVLERAFLRAFVRHELLRISDMLDPHFEYLSDAPLGGESPAEENLVRDHFRVLWDLYIDHRLGQVLPDSEASREVEKRVSWTQGELLELARNEWKAKILA